MMRLNENLGMEKEIEKFTVIIKIEKKRGDVKR